LFNENDVDWAPSLKLGHQKKIPQPSPHRGVRIRQREDRKRSVEAAGSLLDLLHSGIRVDKDMCAEPPSRSDNIEMEECPGESTHSVGCQTELTVAQICSLESDYNRLSAENIELRKHLASSRMTEESLCGNDDRVRMLTGVPTFTVLMTLYSYLQSSLCVTHSSSLTKFQQLLVVLLRLKLGFSVNYIADLFRVSASTVSKVFLNTLNVMYVKLKPCIYWPEREELRETMPMDFRKHFGLRVAVIIDCFEIFIH